MRPVQDIHDQLLSLFTPINQPHGDRGMNHTGEQPFSGDCDDYYTAAFNQLYLYGYDPYMQLLKVRGTEKRHMVACVVLAGRPLCLDHNREVLSDLTLLREWYIIGEQRHVLKGGRIAVER